MILNTAEKFLLINKHPTKRRFLISEISLNYGIIGAILLDMSAQNYLSVENNQVIVKNNSKTENPIFDEISTIIRKSKKTHTLKYWLSQLSLKSPKIKWLLLNDLSAKKLIRIQQDSFIGLISYRSAFLSDSKYRNDLIVELKNKILTQKNLKDEDLGILGLIDACKMQKIISSDRAEQKMIKTKLKKLIKESPISTAVESSIRQLQLAISAALVSTTLATTVSSSVRK